MKKLTCVLLASSMAFIMTSAMAAPKNFPAKAAKSLALSYLGAIGCPDDDTFDPKLISKFSDASLKIEGHVVVVNSDSGCYGGTGTVAPTLVFMQTAEGKDGMDDDFSFVKVDPAISGPIARVNNSPRALTSIYQKGGQLYATGLGHGKDDANCCPSVKSVHRIVLQKKVMAIGKDDTRDVFTWNFLPVK